VLCDRFAASSIAYQGYGRGLGRETVERANDIATGGLVADLTLLLDLPVEEGIRRRAREGAANHFDRETVAFHERVRAGYLELARGNDRWRVIDASQSINDVIAACEEAIVEILP
jgi:dTMP kinase